MNTLVSYPIAKLLKEKGYNEQTIDIYQDGEILRLKSTISNKEFMTSRNYSAPTIAEVVMWLYEKHGIWISVERYSTLFRPYAEEIGDERFGKWEGHKYSSPTEAYEAAIIYTLNNLI